MKRGTLSGRQMVMNLTTERGFVRVRTGYACYNLARRGSGYACFKTGNVSLRQDAQRWANGDDTVELIHFRNDGKLTTRPQAR